MGCFSAAGTEGLIRIEEKLNEPKYRGRLNENPVQSRNGKIPRFARCIGKKSKQCDASV